MDYTGADYYRSLKRWRLACPRSSTSDLVKTSVHGFHIIKVLDKDGSHQDVRRSKGLHSLAVAAFEGRQASRRRRR